VRLNLPAHSKRFFTKKGYDMNEDATPANLITVKDEEDRRLLSDQYKVLTESLNKMNEVREAANNFWTGVNGALMGAIAYFRDLDSLECTEKSYLILTLIFLGIVFSSSWLVYLVTIKKSVDIRNEMLVECEKYLPAKIFTVCTQKMSMKQGWGSLSTKEMLVPSLFLLAYISVAAFIYFAPKVLIPVKAELAEGLRFW
jgi:hypothetical protein